MNSVDLRGRSLQTITDSFWRAGSEKKKIPENTLNIFANIFGKSPFFRNHPFAIKFWKKFSHSTTTSPRAFGTPRINEKASSPQFPIVLGGLTWGGEAPRSTLKIFRKFWERPLFDEKTLFPSNFRKSFIISLSPPPDQYENFGAMGKTSFHNSP
jgi:hypothetical protein